MFITRPTSRMAFRAAMVPKVTMWATWSSPYFRRTYSNTSSRRVSPKSMSISGMLTRSGFKNRSKYRLYFMGSMSVMWRQ